MRLSVPNILTITLSSALVLAVVVAVFAWIEVKEEHAVVRIVSDRSAGVGLPVYAQFVVTQTLEIDKRVRATRLEVPFHIIDPSASLLVSLSHNDVPVVSWALNSYVGDLTGPGIVEVSLPFREPVYLDGRLEVRFDGGTISHDQQHDAPRVLVEKDDTQYPGGSYRIANNVKKGDVGMTLYGLQRRGDILSAKWRTRPLDGVTTVFRVLLVILLAGVTPFVVQRLLRSR